MITLESRSQALLAIDAGNTTISFSFTEDPAGNGLSATDSLPCIPHPSSETVSLCIAGLIAGPDIPGLGVRLRRDICNREICTVISSVVPSLNAILEETVLSMTGMKPFFVSCKNVPLISFSVPNPGQIGTDRIMNALGAYFHARQTVAVADCGTATSITVIDGKCTFLGGAILPGIELMQKALRTGTAGVKPSDLRHPEHPIGKTTEEAVNAGLCIGTAGAVSCLIDNMEKELGVKVQLLLTGGYSQFVAPFLPGNFSVVPRLTFEGLRRFYLHGVIRIPSGCES